jgi:hypothetical protein
LSIVPSDSRPPIPKAHAAKIRAARGRLTTAQDSLIHCEDRIDQGRARVAEYEADPHAFATRYYPGHGSDSYPVRTTIAREREALSYYQGSVARRSQEIMAAEIAFLAVEVEMLAVVAMMRPSRGRVAWPERLPPLSDRRAKRLAEFEAGRRDAREAAARDGIEIDKQREQEIVRIDQEREESRSALHEEMLTWSPEKKAAWNAAIQGIISNLRARKTPADAVKSVLSQITPLNAISSMTVKGQE